MSSFTLRRKPIPGAGSVITRSFPESESALRNGSPELAIGGFWNTADMTLLERQRSGTTSHDFVLVSTDSAFERLLKQLPGVVILRSCDYPTEIAADVLRRNAIRIAELPTSQDQLIMLEPIDVSRAG